MWKAARPVTPWRPFLSGAPARTLHCSPRLREPKLNSVAAEKTRNIGIVAHIDAGKTTTTERMLFYAGKTVRIGNVDEGDTVTDYLPSERERGITIQSAAISVGWNGHKVNVIDTPGHADFTFEVTRSLRVLDGAVAIFDAVAGVEAQSEKVWRQAAQLGIPRIAYINKMDRPGAGFSRTVQELVSRLHTRVVLVNMPYFVETSPGEFAFRGVLDVVHKTLLVWDENDETGRSMRPVDVGESQAELHGMLCRSREAMVETLGELDDGVIEAFFECGEDYMQVPAKTLQHAIRGATRRNELTPVLCGSSFRNVGVQPLMDAVVAYLPSPLDIAMPEISSAAVRRVGKKNKKRPGCVQDVAVPMKMDPKQGLTINNSAHLTVALAFKVMTHPARGVLTFFRVYSGKLAANSTVMNTRTGRKVHFKKVMVMHGDVPEEVAAISAGNIGVVAGTNDEIATGDTLVSHGTSGSKGFSELEANLRLLPIEIPPPLFNAGIEPATAGDARHMNDCIQTLLREDPSLSVHVDDDLGQTVLSGMGELHLEIVRDRLVNDMKAKVRLRAVAVSYKESIARPDGRTVRLESAENPGTFVEISLDSFEGEAQESAFAEEDGAICLEQDNNVVIMDASALSDAMKTAAAERRWKCEFSLEELQDKLVTGCATGLQMGGPLFGLPLHSCVVRITQWHFPVTEKCDSASELLELGRKVVSAGIAGLHESARDAICLLEPIMVAKISVGSDVLGDVVHDLNSRCQATISSIDDEGLDTLENQNWASSEAEKVYVPPDYTMKSGRSAINNRKLVVAETPLREMVGYLSRLRSMTQGRGAFDMSYKGMSRVTKTRMVSLKGEFS